MLCVSFIYVFKIQISFQSFNIFHCVLCVSFFYVFKIQISFQSFNIFHSVCSAFHFFMYLKFKSHFNPLMFVILCAQPFIFLCIQNSNLISILQYSSLCVLCVSFIYVFKIQISFQYFDIYHSVCSALHLSVFSKFFSTFKFSSTVLTVPCLFANPLYYFLNVPQLPKFAFFATLKYSV